MLCEALTSLPFSSQKVSLFDSHFVLLGIPMYFVLKQKVNSNLTTGYNGTLRHFSAEVKSKMAALSPYRIDNNNSFFNMSYYSLL